MKYFVIWFCENVEIKLKTKSSTCPHNSHAPISCNKHDGSFQDIMVCGLAVKVIVGMIPYSHTTARKEKLLNIV